MDIGGYTIPMMHLQPKQCVHPVPKLLLTASSLIFHRLILIERQNVEKARTVLFFFSCSLFCFYLSGLYFIIDLT